MSKWYDKEFLNAYQKEWSKKNKDKISERNKKKYKENKTQLKYYYNNREHVLNMKKKYSQTGGKWKARYKATQEQWEHYCDTTHCECCGVEFEEGKGINAKCQDHNHDTGELRGVICNACNLMEGYIRKYKDRLKGIQEYFDRYP